jgi:hypothetical protein
MTLPPIARGTKALLAIVLFAAVAVVYTRPLLWQLHSGIVSDPYDPVLNAAVLWWNATTVPFSASWWNPPFFHPASGVTAFTEHLLGVSVTASPIYWLTRDPIVAYNIALFLTWPLSSAAAWWLARRLTGREDAALIAGFAYGFTPYRLAEIAHIQSLSSYWLPVMLVGLHGYVEERRGRWLVLFGGAWLLQSLANGYYLLMGAVLIGAWVAYFAAQRTTWRTVPAIAGTWALFSIPLVPILVTYRSVHEHFGLRRELYEVLAFSAQPHSFAEVSGVIRAWSRVLPASEHDLFPGASALLLIAAAAVCVFATRRPASEAVPRRMRATVSTMATGAALSVAALGVMMVRGPWRIQSGGTVLFKMDNPNRALVILAACGSAVVLLTPWIRRAVARRNPLVFYAAMTFVMALLACGPVLHVGQAAIMDPAPYRWLLAVPGFDQIRVPRRFWMLGVLSLATASALAFDRIGLPGPSRRVLLVVAVAGILADGWLVAMPMASPPSLWLDVERDDGTVPILELPLGPDWDGAATFRSMAHRRPTFNGVSGYDPAHYAPLQAGLSGRDPDMLAALASLGPYDVVVDATQDRDGAWETYARGAKGASVSVRTRTAVVVRIPGDRPVMPAMVSGSSLPIASVWASAHDGSPAIDGRVDTQWEDGPQTPGQWVIADLGVVRDVSGLSHALGEYARDFPRQLAVDLSVDGMQWTEVWNRPMAAFAFLAASREPRRAPMLLTFEVRPARYVRLRQTAAHKNLWRLSELEVFGTTRR